MVKIGFRVMSLKGLIHHGETRLPPDRQTAEAQDGGEGQTLSLCRLPETQPQAGERAGAVVLSEVPGDEGGGRGCTMKLGQSRSSDASAATKSG